MVKNKFKLKFILFLNLILLHEFTSTSLEETLVIKEAGKSFAAPQIEDIEYSRNVTLRQLRPGQIVRSYNVDLTFDTHLMSFYGKVLINVQLTSDTSQDPIVFHIEDLNIDSVEASVGGSTIFMHADFDVYHDDGILEIYPRVIASSYILLIQYTGLLSNGGRGMFQGRNNTYEYIGMNLHPTNARRVFPCVDDPTELAGITFNFNNLPFSNIFVNTMPEYGSVTEFRPLITPPHLWGMVAHNFITFSVALPQVMMYIRPGLQNQAILASETIRHLFSEFQQWTNTPYFEIVANQRNELAIMALSDTSVDWYALSSICIWEPYIMAEINHSAKQRKVVLTTIAQALSRQWFGYAIYPENWKYQWVVSGIGGYAAYDVLKKYQDRSFGSDPSALDINTLFVTDVIQESLFRDGYTNAHVLEPWQDLFTQYRVRDHVNGLLKYKAPAIMRMLRLVLGREEDDFVHKAATALLQFRSLHTVNSLHFYDAINAYRMHNDYQLIENVEEFLEPWIMNRGYPVIHLHLRQGGVLVTQETFGLGPTQPVAYTIPLTFTTFRESFYDDENVYNIMMLENTMVLYMQLHDDEEDFVLFNIQGQGYYRVCYDNVLWERIINALNNPIKRNQIHPLNRATLIDDALNLARAGKLDYDIAFGVVLATEHETEYAVWKAFVRNMDFIRKRLVRHVSLNEALDQNIYLKFINISISKFEEEIGFYPDPQINEPAMVSLTRGLVMNHACRANYQPCIDAADYWFYDPNSNSSVVNPNIPRDIRPAVFCTMVSEGDQKVINDIYARLEIERSAYERVVIMESLACSRDVNFITSLLYETIDDSKWGVEDRNIIFAVIVGSSYENAREAFNFLARHMMKIRNMYGGPAKLEELIYILTDNVVDDDFVNDFNIWVNSMNNNLLDSQYAAERARHMVFENLEWNKNHLENVYKWIYEQQ